MLELLLRDKNPSIACETSCVKVHFVVLFFVDLLSNDFFPSPLTG